MILETVIAATAAEPPMVTRPLLITLFGGSEIDSCVVDNHQRVTCHNNAPSGVVFRPTTSSSSSRSTNHQQLQQLTAHSSSNSMHLYDIIAIISICALLLPLLLKC